MFPYTPSELNAVLLQALITAGLATLCYFLYRQYRKRYFLWWAVAWAVYVVRIGAILGFLVTTRDVFLYAHQVLSGWTALGILGAALVFSQRLRWRSWYWLIVAFPPVWSYVAIYRLDHFLLAAGPAVLFLSIATLWTGFVFLGFARRVESWGAPMLATVFILWGLHHLDYPILRARGAWNPWGYYIDILFVLATGVGTLLLVLEDQKRGLTAMTALSGDLQPPRPATTSAADELVGVVEESPSVPAPEVIDSLLARPLSLAGVRGSALYLADGDEGGRFVRGVGACEAWQGTEPRGEAWRGISAALQRGAPVVSHDWRDPGNDRAFAYAAALPLVRDEHAIGALVFVGDESDPFTALGDEFLHALGQQVGGALANADLTARLEAHAAALERLATRMVQQHEQERRRISLELHDETAQMFAAVKLQLGVLRESLTPELQPRLDRVLELVDAGMRSIRSVTRDLRPPLLDDLGLAAALRAVVSGFTERTGLPASFDAPATLPAIGAEGELALFRALQEALSNVARHAQASRVDVEVGIDDASLRLEVRDDGRGLGGRSEEVAFGNGRMGLTGMRERLVTVGGTLALSANAGGGLRLVARLPLPGSRGTT